MLDQLYLLYLIQIKKKVFQVNLFKQLNFLTFIFPVNVTWRKGEDVLISTKVLDNFNKSINLLSEWFVIII